MRTTLIIADREIETVGHVDRLFDMARKRTIEFDRSWGRVVRLGRSVGSHIRCTEDWVSRDQAVLVRGLDGRWQITHVGSAGNRTWVNGKRVPDTPTTVTLDVGSILRVGWTVFIATNAEQEVTGRWVIAASHEREFYCSALLVYGSFVAAAQGIGVADTTFRDRIKRWAAQGDRMAQDALQLAELQRRSKDKRRRTHPLPIATMAICMEAIRAPEDEHDEFLDRMA